MFRVSRRVIPVLLLIAAATALLAQHSAALREERTVQAFERAKSNPLELHAFLVNMPKGADLHMHLSGAVYAETLIADAVADHLCIDQQTFSLAKAVGTSTPGSQTTCLAGQLPAAAALRDQRLYDRLIDSFSMRSFVPTTGVSGHDQFFATFARFGGIDKTHAGEWLDEVATRAAVQNEQYLEVMQSPDFSAAARAAYSIGWPGEVTDDTSNPPRDATPLELAALREKLLAAGLRDEVAVDRSELEGALEQRHRIEHCEQQTAAPGCTVKVRFLGQVLRAFPPQQVFAQTLLYFELAAANPQIVAGINFVQPEDAYLSMREYHRQMLMLDYLHGVYPQVHISLHAGELAPGLVPPAGLGFHIREAVELGHAERIGHGVDVMYERQPKKLLQEMADRHVMVEINLTSNDLILGVVTNWHSLPEYLAAHVPVALSTDDEGVSRIDLTHEYTRAAMDFHLGYRDLKRMARTGLEHAFLPGERLWVRPDDFARPVAACSTQELGADRPTAACESFLQSNEKAAEEWNLEHRFAVFESGMH